jgi:serine/threonine protein kinase
MQHAESVPEPPSARTELEIPPAIDAVILACLAKDPDRRPSSAAELARLLLEASPQPLWDDERAQGWWERHHPESAGPETCHCHLTLTKALSSEPVS